MPSIGNGMSLPYKAEVKHHQDGAMDGPQKFKALLDGRTPRFFSQRVIPRWRVTQGTNRHVVVGRPAPVTSALDILQSSSRFFQSFAYYPPYRVPCPVPQRSLLVTLLGSGIYDTDLGVSEDTLGCLLQHLIRTSLEPN